jgi:hypothetical protein
MKRTSFDEMAWLKYHWPRPFDPQAITDLLTHLASHNPQTPLVLEARGCQGQISYYLGVDRQYVRIITDVMRAHGDIRFSQVSVDARTPVNVASQLKISKPILSLKTDIHESCVRAGLAALLQPKGDEQAVLQVVLGQPFGPRPAPVSLPDPHASWIKAAIGGVGEATTEAKNSVKEKFSHPCFNAVVRLGATGTRDVGRGHILSMLSALRTLRSAGVSIQLTKEDPAKLNRARIPWQFPYRLSTAELSNFLMLPAGDADIRGAAGLHPKLMLPPKWYQNPFPIHDRTFAMSLDNKHKLSISPKDSLLQTHILGPIGSGKSTAMQRMILSDAYAGKSLLVIDPKQDLVTDILARIPKHRENDVVVIDPSSSGNIVGLNPLAYKNHHNPGLIADAILAVFQEVFKENWGIRSQDVISAALLTLVQVKGSSLLWLPTLLTDEAFRKRITAGINDKIGLEPFWAGFEAMRDSERRQEILPTLNKVRQFLLRPGLRNVLGQSDPKFDLNDLFTKPRIVLVPLNKGIIGAESAKLLGSLIVGLVWTLALSRAGIPEEKRKPVSIYIDELQDYISSIGKDFSDALAQARGLGVGFTTANQYLGQLPPEIRLGVEANCRNKICFGVSATDAKAMAAMAPELTAEDFMAIPRFHVYCSFNDNGRSTGWISGRTLPTTPALRDPAELKAKVAARYGRPGSEVEQEYIDLLAACREDDEGESEQNPVGKKAKV